jgi:hypothetical protein
MGLMLVLDNVDMRSSLVAWLKANSAIVATLKDPLEIRELDWQGEKFTYPNIRVTCAGIFRECWNDVNGTISYFSEQKSSKQALVAQGIIARQLHLNNFTQGNIRFFSAIVSSLPDAVQVDGIWRADVILTTKASSV